MIRLLSYSRRVAPVAVSCIGATSTRAFAAAARPSINVTFVTQNGSRVCVSAPIGDSMLEVAHANKIDIEGACGGEVSCSTCHVYVDQESLRKIPKATEAEEDMLDLAAGLRPNSRLGCQIIASKELDGMTIELPQEVSNMMSKD